MIDRLSQRENRTESTKCRGCEVDETNPPNFPHVCRQGETLIIKLHFVDTPSRTEEKQPREKERERERERKIFQKVSGLPRDRGLASFGWPVSKVCVREDAKVNFCSKIPSKTERKCRRRADICTFCNDAINNEVRTLFSYPTCYKSFCKDAEHLHGLWKKWGQLDNQDVKNTRIDENKSDLQRYRSLNDLHTRRSISKQFDNTWKIESNLTSNDRYEKKYDSENTERYKDGNQNWNNDGYKENRKSRFEGKKKVDGSRLNEPREKVKADKRRFEGKEENSRGRALGGRDQESPGKMIHDRAGQKNSSPRTRGRTTEIESEETAASRGRKGRIRRREGEKETEEEETRQRGGSKGKKGDAVDRLSGRAYRQGDEEKKFLNSREKRKKDAEGNENKVKNRDLPSGKKHRTDTEKSASNLEGGESTEPNDRMRARSRSRKLTELNLTTEEEFERTNGSRYRNTKFYPTGCQNEIDDMYTVFTPGGKDVLGVVREPQIIAAFDTLGNGIILNENGVTRLSYNQIGGIWRDNPAGLPFQWTWSTNVGEPIIENVYSEKSIGDLEKLLSPTKKHLRSTETSKTSKTPSTSVRTSTREKAEIVGELEQKPVVDAVVVVGEREEDLESELIAKPEDRSSIDRDNNAVKIICLRLNEYLSFRILDRRNVNLQFFAGSKSIRIELGTVLNCKKILGSYHSDDVDWKSDVHKCRFEESFDKKLEPESSLYDLSREYQRVRKYTRERDAMIEKYKPSFKHK